MNLHIPYLVGVVAIVTTVGVSTLQVSSGQSQLTAVTPPDQAPTQQRQAESPVQGPLQQQNLQQQPSQSAQQNADSQVNQSPCPPIPPQINQPQYQNGPQVNIGRHHGNMRQAQIFLVESYQAMTQAQQMNEDQLGGHAQRAKDLMLQADVEIRLAANTSNQEGR